MKTKLSFGVMLFALLWALAAFLPPVRESVRALPMWLRDSGFYSDLPGPLPQMPDDPITTEWKLENEYYSQASRRDATLQKWDALAAKFPDERWISAARLCFTLLVPPRYDTGAEKQTLAAQETETPKAKTGEKTPDWAKAALIAAREGAREPDNAFWPWMEASFRFAQGQRGEGVAAMERAAGCTRFEDYAQSTVRARLELWQQHDSPSWEERLYVSFSSAYPHMLAMRDVNRATALEALRARTAGDTARALRIGGALLNANAVWRRDSETFTGSLIAENNGREALERLFGLRVRTGIQSFEELEKRRPILRNQWIAFARANQRRDLERRADWLAEPSISKGMQTYWNLSLWGQVGLPAPQGRLAALTPLLLAGIATLCLLGALTWLVGTLFSRRLASPEAPTRGQVALCANFTFWLVAGVLLLVWNVLQTAQIQPFSLNPGSVTFIPLIMGAVFMLGCWLLPVGFVSWGRGRRFRLVRSERDVRVLGRYFGVARTLAWLLFFGFAAVVASNGQGMWDDTLLQIPVSGTLGILSLVAAVTLEIVRFRRVGRTFPRLRVERTVPELPREARLWRIAHMGAWTVAVLCLSGVLLGSSDLPPLWSAFALPIGVVAVVAALVIGRKTRGEGGFPFRLATRSAGVLTLAWSFVFVGLALGLWPLRMELNRQLDRRMEMNEVAWMKEQIARNPVPSSP